MYIYIYIYIYPPSTLEQAHRSRRTLQQKGIWRQMLEAAITHAVVSHFLTPYTPLWQKQREGSSGRSDVLSRGFVAVAAEKTGDAARRDSAPRRGTRWQYLKLQVIFRKRATNYRALLRGTQEMQLDELLRRVEVRGGRWGALCVRPRVEVAVSLVCGSFFAKEPITTGLFCGKWRKENRRCSSTRFCAVSTTATNLMLLIQSTPS